ncbi:polyketide synthase, putative [Cordyceps militaris]|uniref:Polyketide synthase, putative n=1 Tax=Cordyceps militaris TaxID=73501 RepID=A0A2H4SSK0_CORMI|nr:polyketide synthase, putative [Cordyceps militaris]
MSQTNQEALPRRIPEPVAIIGSACRFPGGCNAPSKLWDLLRQPRDILKELNPDRLNLNRYYNPNGESHGSTDVANKAYTLDEDISRFDAAFFGISPLEAAGMDPQQRMLLEVVYESTETAGIPLDKLRGSLTSVHVGVMTTDWAHMQRRDPETMPQYTATGVASSIISNRISYIFDLRGVSETIDTACSSSLVALHNAARALQSGDCEKAIVAGVNLILDPDPFIFESKLHMLSPDSRSRMWDKAANGYARGEGASAVVLKTLRDALRDGDHIEGVVRSTYVNSDGLSSGLTMPSAAAQTALIRQTYLKAGLDPVMDRPQFFECHGTGTKAGDPVEARAISDAFVTGHTNKGAPTVDDPLYVGSIKTVVGHLEGCAGLAGVLKVLLSLKHGVIPPNLLFEELNPDIDRYYGPLQIPTTSIPWPELRPGVPLRASVNSFGFGGTNAHAIIERYDASQGYAAHQQGTTSILETPKERQKSYDVDISVPILLTARTGAALWRTVHAYARHLRQHPALCLADLSTFLHSRRSIHRVRAHFSGITRAETLESMEAFVKTHSAHTESAASHNRIGYSPLLIDPKEVPGVLGVFTGQGAQWPAMGCHMMRQSPVFRETIAECEAVLQALPLEDAPSWSLYGELTKGASTSRITEAEISQPLCTAVQLALVNVLRASGVHFDAVIGHSSGEIAATYASDIITLQGAMQIAYYRGFHAKLARGTSGQAGGMMAVGLSMKDAVQVCRRPEFDGRIQVAASNAPQSVTLSGDKEAIAEAMTMLTGDGVFARELKVDTAYHSHHMIPCAQPYLKSLIACDIQILTPTPGKCIWSSSVRGDAELLRKDRNLDSLKGPYWVANMVQTVLFSRAVESSIWHGGPFDLVVEVGPHPALKGPTEQTLKAAFGSTPLYTGLLKRGTHDGLAFSTAIGSIWAHLGPAFVDLSGYHSVFSGEHKDHHSLAPTFVHDLPSYPWDHEETFWRESRISRRYRTGKDGSHELLGRRTPDDNDREIRWRNLLKISELPWTQGHTILGEVLLPGAAYISMAIEAGSRLAVDRGKDVRLLEVSNVDIYRPVVVSDSKEGTETLFTIRILEENLSNDASADGLLRASFSFYIFNNAASSSILHTCEGLIAIHLGSRLGSQVEYENSMQLPQRVPSSSDLQEIDCEKLYSLFGTIGLEYSGVFRRITRSRRQFRRATAFASWDRRELNDCYTIHPAILDVAFQTIFIARAHPDSGQVNSALLPSHIERVRVVPTSTIYSKPSAYGAINADVDSWILNQTATSLTGDLNVYDADTGAPLVQVQGFEVRTVGETDASKDRLIFSETVWGPDVSIMGLSEPVRHEDADATVQSLAEAGERVSLFYVRRLMSELTAEDRDQANWYHTRMLQAFDHHLTEVKNDTHLHLRREWLSDDWAAIHAIDEAYPDTVELQMLHAVGKNMASVIKGEQHMLEVMRVDDMLDRFYADDKGMQQVNHFLAGALKEITFKFPRCNILEIGAGTGATTSAVLNALDDAFDTYTYTDLSVGFFETAMERFSSFRHKMIFKALDVEKDVATQGFDLGSYDIIIAANVLHATRSLEVTLGNVRSLLKAGGYLLLNEKTGAESLRATFNFGGLQGWWLAEEEDRQLSPLMSPGGWDAQLQRARFSGIDHVVHDIPEEPKQQTSLIMSQAVDDMFYARLSPLSEMASLAPTPEPLLIIGGQTPATFKIIKEMKKLLPRQWRQRLRLVDCIDNLMAEGLAGRSDVICLQELDKALFTTPMTSKRLDILQNLLIKVKNLLWVTSAQTSSSMTPRATMFRGITRVMKGEVPQINTQIVGIEPVGSASSNARSLLEAFIRLQSDYTHDAANIDVDDAGDTNPQALWSHESELDVLSNGAIMIPRVKLNKSLNDTYNTSARTISKRVDTSYIPIQVVTGPAKVSLQPVDEMVGQVSSSQHLDSRVRIDVKFTLHIPQSSDGASLYLICGRTHSAEGADASSISVIALSPINASTIHVPSAAVSFIEESDLTPEILVRIFQHISMQAVEFAREGKGQHQSVALIYGADETVAELILARHGLREKNVHFASSRTSTPESWLKIHPLCNKLTMSQILPFGVGVFIDCLSTTESDDTRRLIPSCLPASCTIRPLDANLFLKMSQCSVAVLNGAYSYAKTQMNHSSRQNDSIDVLPATELVGKPSQALLHSVYITNWQNLGSALVTMPPLKTQDLFQSDRTYLMVGAAGGVGTSLCRWMVRHGARHVIVTSRNPKGDPTMLSEAKQYGATVRVVSMDVCDRRSVEAVVGMIRATMPPIAGVCNAAMVLCDKLFLDMDVDILNNTLGPKVDGTEILDSIFSEEALDFFILLGSTATIANNIGQSNYHCANLYMDSLVAQRRSRGLAASIIHIGYICDTGYVARLGDDAKVHSNRDVMRATTLSETDVHHAFAEAVRGGSPGSPIGSYNIIMGIDPPTKSLDSSRRKALWLSDPRLGHMVPYSASADQAVTSEQAVSSSGSIAQQVIEASTDDEAGLFIQQAFASKLETVLLLAPGSIGEDGAGRPVTDLGIDSLVAVEVRTWFLKQLRVDMPVMKILGGSTIGQLSTLAAKLARQGAKKDGQQQVPKSPLQNEISKASSDTAGKGKTFQDVKTVDAVTQGTSLTPAASDGGESTSNPTPSSSVSEVGDSLQDSRHHFSEGNSASTVSSSSNTDSDPGEERNTRKRLPSDGHADMVRPSPVREAQMSPAQSRIWFLSKHMAEPDAYNMVFHYRVRGHLSMVRLRHAMQAVTSHHECLRMCFYADEASGQPMQGLLASSGFQMRHEPDCDEERTQRELRRLKTRAWSIESGETLELVVLGRPGTEEEYSLLFGYHHIIMDAISWSILLKDLDKAYRMLPLDKAAAGSHLDLTEMQLQQERDGVWDESLNFWKMEFETIPDILPSLPVSLPSPQRANIGTHRVLREFPREQGDAIRNTCKSLRISPFSLHIAVLQVILSRLAGIEDVCIGIVDANRSDPRASQMVGCFVNMLPIRARLPGTATLAQVARAASSKALSAFAHGAVPLDKILDSVKAPRPAGSTPLFQVALNYRPATSIAHHQPLGAECQIELVPYDIKDADNPFEVSVLVTEVPGGGLGVEMFCQKATFTMDGSRAVLEAYVNGLDSFLSDTSQSVSNCSIYAKAEIDLALELGKGPPLQSGWPSTLSERVMKICQQYPAKPAIKDGLVELSYAELQSRVDEVASSIISTGCGAGSRVVVQCQPSIDAIVAMLAILHVGAVYVPLDISLPDARHLALVSNCSPSLILYHAATVDRAQRLSAALSAPGYEPPHELLVDSLPSPKTQSAAPLRAEPDVPAILLYTSGTTGTPKGVVLTQSNFRNHIALKTGILNLGRGESVLQQSSLGFDMSLVQTFCALASGGCLVIVPSEARRDPGELTSLIARHGVSLTIATPSEYLAWLQYGSESLTEAAEWRCLCMGGEPISQILKDELRRLGRNDLMLTNCYGPTETTAAVSFQTVSLELDSRGFPVENDLARYAVGKALPNYSIRIMDSASRWLPANHTGEIAIGGAGVALGYLGLPQETQTKFVQVRGQGERLYRTGDKGRLLSDGTLLCFGRIEGDSQIKLRGLRIELQEVEAAVVQASQGLVQAAVVSRREDMLVAHCTLSASHQDATLGEQQTTTILRRLFTLLPQYSVPATIAIVPSLPTTANGKLDRKAVAFFPLASPNHAATAFVGEKMTIRQGELRLLWERVLSRDGPRITPESDFFLRGGNSLLLMKLQAAIRESMGVRVPTKALYHASTLSAMAQCVVAKREEQLEEKEVNIDWAAEVVVPASMRAQVDKLSLSETTLSRSVGKTTGLEILLTGATGFLGGQLLLRLLQAPEVNKIHCIAVSSDERHLLEQQKNAKIVYYTGNIAASGLGLGPKDKTHLERVVDIILHAGSMGHCLNTYSTLAAPNLASTKTLCSLALSRSPPIPFAFVSSNRVVLLTGSPSPPPGSVAAFPPPADGTQGYTASKWASEVFLERLSTSVRQARKGGVAVPWKVAIHRPCALVSDEAPNSDALNAILRYSASMRCVPSLPRERARGYLDFGQVDQVVEEMVGDVLGLVAEGRDESPGVTYKHHSGGVKVPIHEFREHMESVYGESFESVDLSKWIAQAVDAGMDPLISAYLETFLDTDEPMSFPYMGEEIA